MVLTLAFPRTWKPEGSVLFFFFGHPTAGATAMTFFDIGASAFVIVMGLVFSISFRKRLERDGLRKAVSHVTTRYGVVLLLGLMISIVSRPVVEETNGMLVIGWDVLPTLGLVGFVALLFISIKDPRVRMAVGYAWMVLYQVLLLTAGLKAYAQASVSGGIFGAIFGFAGQMIVASALADYLFFTEARDKRKYSLLAIFVATNLVVGILIGAIPGWEAAKAQVSFAYCLVSLGVTMLGGLLFVYFDRVLDKNLAYLQAFGQNSLLAYLLAEAPSQVLKQFHLEDLGLTTTLESVVVTAIRVTYVSLVVIFLYRRQKIYSTEKVALIFTFVILALAAILLPLSIL